MTNSSNKQLKIKNSLPTKHEFLASNNHELHAPNPILGKNCMLVSSLILQSPVKLYPWQRYIPPPPIQKKCFIGLLSVVTGGSMLMPTAFAPLSIVSV